MSSRVTIIIDGQEWRATTTAAGVAIEGTGVFEIRDDEGVFTAAAPEGTVRGVAARAGEILWVSIDGEVFECRVVTSGRRPKGGGDDLAVLSAPMPATVVRVAVKSGDAVRAGDVLIALEAMKMELPIRAPRDGVVTAIQCREGELVQPGVQLVELGSGLGSKP